MSASIPDATEEYRTGRMVHMTYKRIRELREKKGLSQARVGSLINFPQRTYAYYESGKRMLPPEVLCALARLYGVTTDYILELSDDPNGGMTAAAVV